MSVSSWLKQGSTAVGIIGAAATTALATLTPLAATHPTVAVITGVASFLAMVWPEGKAYVTTTQNLLLQLEPVVEEAWPYIQAAIAQFHADKAMVPTTTGTV